MGKAARFVLLTAKSLVLCLGLAFVVHLGVLYVFQNRIIYHPGRYTGPDAEAAFPRKLVELKYAIDGAPQVSFYAPPDTGGVPDHIWVFYSGNGGRVLEYHDLFAQAALAHDGLLLVDYPGYGFNGGTPSLAGTMASTREAIAQLALRLDIPVAAVESKLNAAGHSLGTGAALELAVADPAIRHVVVIAPFTSLCDMARLMLGYPVCVLIRHNIDEEAALNTLAARNPRPTVTLFNGSADTVIPPAMGRKMADEHPGWVDYHEMPGAGHIDIVHVPRVVAIAQAMAAVERTP